MANVKYVAYGTVRVSRRWCKVLRAADRAKVGFHVTSGHRTMAEQERLFEINMVQVGARWVQRAGHPLTAFPSVDAPHIFEGRHAHAIDVNALDGGEARLQKWLESHGVRMSNPVPGEAWHMVANPHDLRELAAKLNDDGTWTGQRMSAKGIEFLIVLEGIKLYAYTDPAGHATFGVGHLLHRGAVTAADRAKWGTPSKPKPRSFAMKVLQDDIKGSEAAVRAAVGRRLAQYQFDAFVSMCFNIGDTGFINSTAARRSRQRKPKLAADAMMLWVTPPVLRARRERERHLFLTGRYK